MTSTHSRSRGGTVLRNLIALGSSQAVTIACTAISTAVVPRFLGDAHFGKLSLGLFLVQVIGLMTDLGANTFLTKEIARQDSRQSAASYTFNAIMVRLPLTVIACATAILFVNVAGYDQQTKSVLYVMLPSIVIGSFASVLSASLTGLQEMKPMAWTAAFSRIVYTVIVFVLLKTGHGLIETAAVSNVSAVIWLGTLLPFASRSFSLKSHFDLRIAKMIFFGGLPFLLWQASLLAYGQLDILVLSLMTSDEVIGWYAAAYQIILLPGFIPTVFLTALFPLLSRLAKEDFTAFAEATRRGMLLLLVAVTPIAIGTFVIAEDIVKLLRYPEGFDNSIPLIRILALHMPSVAATTMLGSSLLALDRQRRWAVVGVAAALINPALNVAAIPLTDRLFDNGAIGAAVATDITELFMAACALWLLPKGILQWHDLVQTLKCFVAAGVMGAAVWFIRGAGIYVSVPAGALIYGGLVLAFGLVRPADLRQLKGYMSSRSGRPTTDEGVVAAS